MNIELYKERKAQRESAAFPMRIRCEKCLQPEVGCYCALIQPIELNIHFVILIHPLEARRRIATGRMSHLCLKNSSIFRGHDFTKHKDVNAILSDTSRHAVILYPGANSANLSRMSYEERSQICPMNKDLTIFVLDGTWATAKKMIKHSQNLKSLPRICFSPEKPSNFRVRKQPNLNCYSTIEAIHHTIELLGPSFGLNLEGRLHDNMLKVFDSMVELQLDFIQKSNERQGPSRYRRAQR